MSDIGPGFDALVGQCRKLGMVPTLGPPSGEVPETILNQPLDTALARLYAAHDHVWWWDELYLHVWPVHGHDGIGPKNESQRAYGEDYVPPYPFEELLIWAQLGRQASYLASVPALADARGAQPVLLLDTHEDPYALPLAFGADAAFALLARYLERATATGGRAGIEELCLPWDVGDLVASDAPLREVVRGGRLDAFTRGDASVEHWIETTFG